MSDNELTKYDGKAVLAVMVEQSDLEGAMTVRQYLGALLSTLWEEGERFGGKRPFGNSGWEYDLYRPLVKAGIIEGQLDDDGDILDVNSGQGYDAIQAAIDELISPS